MIRRAIRFLDQRAGGGSAIGKALRYVFPDHWTFLFGEIALYSFLILVATGVYLTLFFEPSSSQIVYHGSYAPLQGQEMSKAYASAVDLSFDVRAGLLIRQVHHWTALVFLAAIVLHLMRIFFTGAYRKPRDLNYYVGLTMLILAVVEGYAGYSLLDDLLSGMGLAIGNAVALSVPGVGGQLGTLIWGGRFPGTDAFFSRLYIAHVLIFPVLIGSLMALHLALIAIPRHSQFRGRRRSEANVIGTPLWPGYALRSLGLFFAVAAVLFALGGLVQINPIWQWGPYAPYLGTNGAQPDWYLGWLIGALRLMPHFDVVIGGYTLIPNPFWGGVLFPAAVFGFLYAWPALERRLERDRAQHNLLDRPRDNPRRTAIGAALFAWVATIFFAGAADRAFVQLGVPYEGQLWGYRAASLLIPVAAYFLARRVCERLREGEGHPGRGSGARAVARNREGGFEELPAERAGMADADRG
ncbi:MAG TPA: cytochrome b N-terminal domain-containing protein [Solirubrobacterales bacterium]|nr:cytochrome b N-terminal domain-containing protein [Solirubrobacterales bacterium]